MAGEEKVLDNWTKGSLSNSCYSLKPGARQSQVNIAYPRFSLEHKDWLGGVSWGSESQTVLKLMIINAPRVRDP